MVENLQGIAYLKSKVPREIYHHILSYVLPSTPVPKPRGRCAGCRETETFLTMLDNRENRSCPFCSRATVSSEYDRNFLSCSKCRAIFRRCCLHSKNGCTYDIEYAAIPTSYEIDECAINGMPIIESNEILHNLLKVFVITINYTCGSALSRKGKTQCPRAYYPHVDVRRGNIEKQYEKPCNTGITKISSFLASDYFEAYDSEDDSNDSEFLF